MVPLHAPALPARGKFKEQPHVPREEKQRKRHPTDPPQAHGYHVTRLSSGDLRVILL